MSENALAPTDPTPVDDPGAGRHAAFSCPRRQVLLGAGVGGVMLVAAACGSSSGGSDVDPTQSGGAGSSGSAPSSAAAGGSSGASSGASVQGIIAVSEVPTDSAVSVKADGKTLLVTQSGGKLAAYDATCPHQGCTVAPQKELLVCPCHNSEFSLTGAVQQGPATSGLTAVAVKDESGQVVLA